MKNISFVPLKESDLSLLSEWLSSEFVKEWYQTSDSSLDGVRAKYLPRIIGEVPIKCFIILVNKIPVGYLQSYWYSDFPSPFVEKKLLPDKVTSLDIFLSNQELTGKGLGGEVLSKFLKNVIFDEWHAEACLVDPASANTRAIHAYQKIGFVPFKKTEDIELLIIYPQQLKLLC